jgi:ADP-heptose:LPS heptosyltransferase
MLKSAALVNLAILERMVHPRQPDLADIRNFLILQYPLALGTAIHATPLIAAIHAAIPGARVSAAASGFALEVLRNNPGLDRLVPTPSPLRELLPAANAIRRANIFGRERYAVLLTTGNERSRIILSALLAGSPTRAGFTLLPELAVEHLRFDPRLSQIANNLRILELLGHGSSLLEQLQADPSLLEPVVYFSPSDLEAAQTLLQEINPGARPVTAFVMQGSGGQRTSWHDDRFVQVIRHIESLGHSIIFLGTASDAVVIDRIRSLSGSTGESLAGRTSIPQLAALLCLTDLLITLDTGTMHVGRVAGLPMAVLGPSWQKPIEWLPLGKPNVRILRGEDRTGVPPDYRLDEITAAAVIAAVEELRHAYPPSEQQHHQRVARLLSTTRTT